MSNERKSALPLNQLDKASRARIEHLLGIEPAAISQGDREFLWGRRDYLTAEQRADYGVDTNPTEDTEEEDGDQYDAMTAPQLKDELKARGLAVGGKVDDLRERLRADDEDVDEE